MFKNKNKKGFTLVELLTVIVILGVLAMVATPMVLGVIKSIKKSAAESSAYAYIKAINYQNNAAQSFDKDSKLADDTYDVLKLDINSKGNKPVFGEVKIVKGNVKTASMCIGGYFVDYVSGEAKAGEECANVTDTSAPELVLGDPIITTNSIFLPFETYDDDTGISSVLCSYGLNTKYQETGVINENMCELTNLKSGTKYFIKVQSQNKGGLSISETIQITTNAISAPIWVDNNPGYVTSKKLTVTFEKGNVENPVYLIRSTVSGKTSVNLRECTSIGTPKKASDCAGMEIASSESIEPYTWYMIQNGTTADITIQENGSLYAAIGDGVQTSEASTITLTTIDTSAPNLELGTPSTTINSITIPISTNSDSESNISNTTCVYGTTNGIYNYNGTVNSSKTSCSLTGLLVETTYYYKVVTTNSAGLTTTKTGSVSTSSFGTVTITSSPTSWATSKTITVTGTASGAQLQYKVGSSGTWTNITSGGTFNLEANNTIYARLTDGSNNTSSEVTYTVTTIDTEPPTLSLGTITKTTTTVIIPFEATDSQTTVSVSCSYGTSTSYGSTGNTSYSTSASTNKVGSCRLSNLTAGTKYYYKLVSTDAAGRTKTETGSVETGSVNVTFTQTEQYPENNEYAILKNININYESSNLDTAVYYFKSSVIFAAQDEDVYACGSDTNPGTCDTTATSDGEVGTWYKLGSGASEVVLTFASNGTLYGVIYDGNSYITAKTYTVTNMDSTQPTLTIGTVTATTSTISIPITVAESESGIDSVTCTYGTSSNTENTGSVVANSTTTNAAGNVISATYTCTLSGLSPYSTYKYKVVAKNLSTQLKTTTGTAYTNGGEIDYSFAYTSSSYDYLTNKNIILSYYSRGNNPIHYVKTTVSTTSNVTGYSCGNATDPGTCETTGTTSYAAGYWYKVTTNPTVKFTSNGTVYALIKDGSETYDSLTYTFTGIDSTTPSLTLGTIATTTTTITVPISVNKDNESGIISTTCKVSTGTYGSSSYVSYDGIVNSDKTSCSITGLTAGTTYYLEVITTNGAGLTTKMTSSVTIGSTNIDFSTTQYPTNTTYAQYKNVTVKFGASNITTSEYYVKATSASTSNVTGYACGNSTNPSTCSSSGTTSFTAGYWYKVSSNPTLKIATSTFTTDSNGNVVDTGINVYGLIHDGNTYLTASSLTLTKIDTTYVTSAIGTVTTSTSTISVPYTFTDNESGISSVSCSYGTTSGTYNYSGTVTRTSYNTDSSGKIVKASYICNMTGLSAGTTYYYIRNGTNGAGKTVTYAKSTTTGAVNVTIAGGDQYPEDTEYAILKNIVITYETSNLATAEYYFKSSEIFAAQNEDVYKCGTGSTPGTCETTLTDEGEANTWYKLASGASEVVLTFSSNSTIYGVVYDGNSYVTAKTYTETKIDSTQPTLTVGTASATTSTISIPITVSESESGISDVTCTYGTSSNTTYNGTVTRNTYSTNSLGNVTSATYTCTLSGLSSYTNYKYKVTVKNLSTQLKTSTGTMMTKGGSITYSYSQPSSSYTYKTYKNSIVSFSANGSSPTYYVKTSVATTSNVTGYACGNSTNPGTCSTSGTTSYSAGYWYKVASNPTIKFTSNGTVYGLIMDGTTTFVSSSSSLTYIDSTYPSLTLGTPTKTVNSITLPLSTNSDSVSGISSTTCSYGTSTSYGSTGTVNSDKTSCSMTGLASGTTYYYKVVTTNGAGLATTKTGSTTTTDYTYNGTVNFASYDSDIGYMGEICIDTSKLKDNSRYSLSVNGTSSVELLGRYISDSEFGFGKAINDNAIILDSESGSSLCGLIATDKISSTGNYNVKLSYVGANTTSKVIRVSSSGRVYFATSELQSYTDDVLVLAIYNTDNTLLGLVADTSIDRAGVYVEAINDFYHVDDYSTVSTYLYEYLAAGNAVNIKILPNLASEDSPLITYTNIKFNYVSSDSPIYACHEAPYYYYGNNNIVEMSC